MATGAFCTEMRASQRKIRPPVIKQPGVQGDDISVPPFMIRMAGNAFVFLGGRKTTVKPGLRLAIGGNILMATGAKRCACFVGARVVTSTAVILDVGMTLNNASGHKQTFQARRVREIVGHGEQNNHTGRHKAS